ncbi:LCP family protein [Halobacillus karajensis]|uniref:Transcriptional regulator YvhJ n=1 Tax=Halobacillus karajensis TaxID=195088 RepID=A0A024P3B4_9BACI|nr:LCP family protein [Halobacillus karajensis]CDQ19194.1 Putative transcriptional regulator YvhJ [Halobacillus karajensis]CDQ22732.1 Putative transcriptional regulator YvhJ [Halobacillus karajensis]CDQ26214.1 Putative transcriptional regulator YvhJ [Halobacillus karajensis]
MAKRIVRVRRRKKKKKLRLLAALLFTISLVVGGGFYYVTQVYTAAYEGLDRGEKSDLREEAVDAQEDPISILLMGVEDYSTDGKAGRADTQIVLTLDPDTNKMTMTSIPRDTIVDIPASKVHQKYAGSHKINAAYSIGEVSGYGAEKLTVETVESLLDIPIDKYATVNFDGFIEIVDLLGGITIDVKKGFWERSSLDYYKKIEFEEGPMKMNGEEALAFVRMRKRPAAVSYTRDERQRQFIKASIDEALSPGTLLKIGDMKDVIGKNVSTNLTPGEMLSLRKAFSSNNTSVETVEIDGANERLNDGLYYFVPDEESVEDVKYKLRKSLDLPVSQQNTTSEYENTNQ